MHGWKCSHLSFRAYTMVINLCIYTYICYMFYRYMIQWYMYKWLWFVYTHASQSKCSILWSWLDHLNWVLEYVHMGVSKNRGTPKWMVYNGKPYQNRWFGGTTIFGSTQIFTHSIHLWFLKIACMYLTSHVRSLFNTCQYVWHVHAHRVAYQRDIWQAVSHLFVV